MTLRIRFGRVDAEEEKWDEEMATAMAMDMLFAGIETTGNTLGFLLYNLATNQEKQNKHSGSKSPK